MYAAAAIAYSTPLRRMVELKECPACRTAGATKCSEAGVSTNGIPHIRNRQSGKYGQAETSLSPISTATTATIMPTLTPCRPIVRAIGPAASSIARVRTRTTARVAFANSGSKIEKREPRISRPQVIDARHLCSVRHSRNQAWKSASLQGSESSRMCSFMQALTRPCPGAT
jgi:hypothetical protein